jgi:UDP-N-acetyl-D-mannosaminuronate dehydrogenase
VDRVEHGAVKLRRRALTPAAIGDAECVLVLTPHDVYDLSSVVERAKLVFDARDVMPRSRGNVVTL